DRRSTSPLRLALPRAIPRRGDAIPQRVRFAPDVARLVDQDGREGTDEARYQQARSRYSDQVDVTICLKAHDWIPPLDLVINAQRRESIRGRGADARLSSQF